MIRGIFATTYGVALRFCVHARPYPKSVTRSAALTTRRTIG